MEPMDPRPIGVECNYKMTENDITGLIKLRATNDAIFTGKRNSAMPAWRAMLKELGLQGRITALQLKKKWENMKMKYKDFKNPPLGMDTKVNPNSWRWFHLMDQAMTGQLAGTAQILNPSLFDMEEETGSPTVPIKRICLKPEEGVNIFEFWAKAQLGVGCEAENTKGDRSTSYNSAATEIRRASAECEMALQREVSTDKAVETETEETEYAISVSDSEVAVESIERKHEVANNERPVMVNASRNIDREMVELERQIAELEKEREILEREQADFDRDRLLMEREREVLRSERETLERGRATLENDRASIDRERAVLDRDRAVLDRDKALIERERAELVRERESFMQSRIAQSNGSTECEMDSARSERRERMFLLFEKLIDKLLEWISPSPAEFMFEMESAMDTTPNAMEGSYKMTEEDVKRLIEFRASNDALFTGKRNSAKIAWNTILRGLGLQGKLTADQIAKKWDNLRTKYKDLKHPHNGQEPGGMDSWPWFHLMNEAMQGRLFNANLTLVPESVGVDTPGVSSPLPNESGRENENQENTDILEFLIKTEMEDSGGTENVEGGGTGRTAGTPTEGIPIGWRRMSECTYKMTEPETERMIKLRAVNEALFTGRKHTAKPAWRAILYELGLQGKVTTDQLAKKWDNLKRRYKELKFPARGIESNPNSWPWFYRMNDAMEGRFAGSAPVLAPMVEEGDDECEPSPPPARKRARRTPGRGGMSEFLTESEMDLLVETEDRNGASLEFHKMTEFSYKLTEEDTRRLIELRAANEALFTGRRNTAKPAWRAIVKEMGLAGKLTPDQVGKKWDNLKTKFKDLKYPPQGMENQTNPASWPWFQLMNDALEGRLVGKAPKLTPLWVSEEDNMYASSPPPPERGGVSELEESMAAADTEGEGTVTYIDASGEECTTPTDFSYKMTEQDTRKLIKLRAANEVLFTGRRNAAKAAWKAILKELGLLGKVSTYQVSKKWDNLKRRYKDLKYPPVGMESMADNAASWPWFHLMNEAMEGRLSSCAPVLTPITQEDDQHPSPSPRVSRSRPPAPPPPQQENRASASDFEQEMYAEHTADECQRASAECERALREERLGRGPAGPANKGPALEREWEILERERAAVERERAVVQAERLWLERERAALQRDRLAFEHDRVALGREREAFESERAMMMNTVTVVHAGHINSAMGM
ncbi:uncharacterized protein [Osmerus mordax]|uniref:uncharacterized protein n=1 Tax=Osmerus mordax TaxID=8014 RepID=UPI003510433A